MTLKLEFNIWSCTLEHTLEYQIVLSYIVSLKP